MTMEGEIWTGTDMIMARDDYRGSMTMARDFLYENCNCWNFLWLWRDYDYGDAWQWREITVITKIHRTLSILPPKNFKNVKFSSPDADFPSIYRCCHRRLSPTLFCPSELWARPTSQRRTVKGRSRKKSGSVMCLMVFIVFDEKTLRRFTWVTVDLTSNFYLQFSMRFLKIRRGFTVFVVVCCKRKVLCEFH
jgi:hypothetical protein